MNVKKFNKNIFKKYKLVNNKKPNKLLILSLSIVFILILNFGLYCTTGTNLISSGVKFVLNTLGIYTEEIKSVEIESNGYKDQDGGSWHIDKSADWTDLNKAQIKFDLNTVVKTGDHLKDVVFVLDISGSMSGTKLERVKEDAKELINYLLSNSNNRVAIITFDSTSTILSEFTNDKDKLIELVEGLNVTGCTNYHAALINLEKVLDGYIRESNKDLVALFLTDGYPNEDTPNQKGEYNILKDKYPYLIINGVQYEMGSSIIQDIIDISDNQYIADVENLNNVLFEASIAPEYYDTFEIVDFIDKDHWYIEDESDIKVDKGSVRLELENGVQKVIWSFVAGEFRTGESAKMTIDVSLKEQYVGTKGFYPTNEKETIEYKLPEEAEKDTSNKTPVLKSWYEVIYDANTPSTCKIDEERETHFAFETVTKQNKELTCEGYIFKGWEIVDSDIKKVNDEVFIMPGHDVTIRAIWSKPSILKSMEGTVNIKQTLYKTVQQDVSINTKYAKKYTGATDTFLGNQDIYYYYGQAANNNVIFGNYCWKVVRTTDTGGVKLIYNGVPSTEGTCNNTGANSALTKEMMGKTSATSAFNSSYTSPAYVGYMYNTIYSYNSKTMTSSQTILSTGTMSSSTSYNYYYSDTYDYRSGRYYLYPTDNPDAAKQIPWIETTTDEEGNTVTKNNYEDLVGKYTCRSTSTNKYCTTLYYVVKADANRMYYISLSSGKGLGDTGYEPTITLSSDIDENGDGTYTLKTPITIEKKDWYTDYSKYKNYYTCGNNEHTCSGMRYATATNNTSITYINRTNEYKYGNSFTYDQSSGQYTLIDTDVSAIKEIWNFTSDYSTLTNNHYTCFNTTGTCTTLSYIYYVSSGTPYYINLAGGKSVEDALNEMLYNEDVNTKDSTIKTAIDYWYEHNMMDYTEYLEDTYWCNDRSMNNQSANGWNSNGGSLSTYLYFKSNGNSSNLTCSNKNDRFTVDRSNGNGALKYPVGLITRQEQSLAYVSSKSPLGSGSSYWSLSPYYFYNYYACGYRVHGAGDWNYDYVYYSYGVRPSVSLRAGIEYSDGDGSVDKPYIVELGE